MSLWRGLTRRLLVVAILFALLGALAVTAWSTRNAFHQVIARVLHPEGPPMRLMRARCNDDPSRFVERHVTGTTTHAYDIDSGRSANLQAPPPPSRAIDVLRSGTPVVIRMEGMDTGILVLRGDPSGPCSVMVGRWSRQFVVHDAAVRAIVISVVIFVVAILVAAVVAVGPFVRRIQRLAGRAERVGESGFEAGHDRIGDALTTVGQVVDRAHRRIIADREVLLDQQQALERHLTDVAHDIRTPLASAQLALESLVHGDALPDAAERALEDVVYLGALVENLRIVSRLEDGADLPPSGPCDWLPIVDRVVARFAALGRLRRISVFGARPDDPVWAAGDAAMAEQMLANLVHNAVTYGHAGGHVAVSLEVQGERFCLRVVDDGPGVDPDVVERLGERALRGAEARRRAPGGSGLGLAIVRAVCARWGWTVTFEANAPTGLRVTVTGGIDGSVR